MSLGRAVAYTIFILAVIVANATLHFLADNNLSHGWPINVVRNWEQYGLTTLKGKMVSNPGGFEVLEKPQVYRGHSPVNLYPVFLARKLFSWTGIGTLAFHVSLCVLLLISIWNLLGKGKEAWLGCAAAMLCPGYTLYQAALDPNAISILMTLPFAALFLPVVCRPEPISAGRALVLLLLVVSYTAFNWTTVLGHGIVMGYLLMEEKFPKKRLLLYIALAALGSAVIVGIGLMGKLNLSVEQGNPLSLKDFIGAYTWGSTGYGANLSTSRAVVRLGFVSVAGMLPLGMLMLYFLWRRKSRRNVLRSFVPLMMAVLGAAVFRNYYGHHPWMVTPLIVVGLVLSCRLLLRSSEAVAETEPATSPLRFAAGGAFLVACFVYALAVTAMYRVNNHEFLAMIQLIRENTSRSDRIVVIERTDPKMAKDASTIAVYGDRRVIVLKEGLEELKDRKDNELILSGSERAELSLLATTKEPGIMHWPGVRHMIAWYARAVSHRKAGDQGFRNMCYLYQTRPSKVSTGAQPSAGADTLHHWVNK